MASPSSYGSRPDSVVRTTTRSPGMMLPTRSVKTPGRSSSAIEARLPSAIAAS